MSEVLIALLQLCLALILIGLVTAGGMILILICLKWLANKDLI